MIIAICLNAPLSVQAMLVGPDNISILPSPQTTNDILSARITGFLPTPGFILDSPPSLSISANTIDITFFLSPPTNAIIQVLDPFTFDVVLGKLAPGGYLINANFNIDQTFSKISHYFKVSPVPVPAAVWLFLSGIVSIFSLTRLKRSTPLSA